MTEQQKTPAQLVGELVGESAALGQQGKFQEAIALCDKAISIDPKFAPAYSNRGNAKSALGRHDEAIKDYDEAIRIKPDLAEAYSNRGLAKSALGRHEEAIKDYDQAIHIDPKVAVAYSNRGNAKSALGRKEEAIKDYDEAIHIDPKLADAYNNRGAAKYNLGQNEEAIEDCSRAIELAPKKPNSYAIRGLAYFKQKEYKRAIEDSDNYLSKNPANSFILSMRGKARIQLKNYSGALEDFEEALRLNPDDKEVAHLIKLVKRETKVSRTKPKGKVPKARKSKTKDETKRVLNKLAKAAPTQAQIGTLGLREETAVFIDICASTEIINSCQVVHYARVFTVLKDIVEEKTKQHPLPIKGLGDGYMVIFDSCDKALHFALDVREGVMAYKASTNQDNMKFDVRIGIDCGIVLPFGDNDRLGICINVASRIEGLKKEAFEHPDKVDLPEKNRVLVSHRVKASTAKNDDFVFTLVGLADIRGIVEKNHPIYLVTRPAK